MKTDPSLPVVVCADALRALYPDAKGTLMMGLKAIAICGPFFLLGAMLDQGWICPIGIALVGWLVIVPHVLRITRFICSLPCAACGLPAGKYTTKKFIIHLKCKHCGYLSRTDCMQLGQGMPTKI